MDISELPPNTVLELDSALNDLSMKENTRIKTRVDPRTKAGAGSECATCQATSNLEEDVDNKGIFYCKSCWDEWEV